MSFLNKNIKCKTVNMQQKIKGSKLFVFSVLLLIIMVSASFYRTGIIINDELQARMLAMQGGKTFYKTEFYTWMNQGRLLAAPINSFTKFLGFIGVNHGTAFKIIQLLILLSVAIGLGTFIFEIENNIRFSILSSVIAFSMMPIVFEHSSPNAFVGFIATDLALILFSLSLYVKYVEKEKNKYVVASMVLFFIAMMSYEACIVYVCAFLFIALAKRKIRRWYNVKFYLIPVITVVIYLILYFTAARLSPSKYDGNQLGISSMSEMLRIVGCLFVSGIPGVYTFIPRYRQYIDFNNISIYEWLVVFIIIGIVAYIFIYVNQGVSKTEEKKCNLKYFYMVLCGIVYMLIPGTPNAISKMYQNNVGINGGFFALPVSYFEYIAGVFVLTTVLWWIIKLRNKAVCFVVFALLLVLMFRIQIMNVEISKIQNNDFERLEKIERCLNSNFVKQLPDGEYYSSDLYQQKHLLAIHENYWSDYCEKIIRKNMKISSNYSVADKGYIYFFNDIFVINTNEVVYVLTSEMLQESKIVRVSDSKEVIIDFSQLTPIKDEQNGIYQYTVQNEGEYTVDLSLSCLDGQYSDGWNGQNSIYSCFAQMGQKLCGSIFYPGDEFAGKKVTVFVDGCEVESIVINETITKFEISLETDTFVEVKFVSNFIYENRGTDKRDIAYIMQDIEVK